MNRHLVIVGALILGLGGTIWWIVSEPDYTIQVVSRERKSVDLDSHRRLVEADPSSAANWAELAAAYLSEAKSTGDQKMYELADGAADRVLQIDSPHRKAALLVQAEVALAREKFGEALAKTDEASAPADSSVLEVRVRALVGLGRNQEADAEATKLMELQPSSASSRLRGLTRQAVGNFEGAERDLIAAIGLEEKTDLAAAIENRIALSRLYLERKDFDRARRVLASALKVSDDARLTGLLGDIESASGEPKKAKAAYEQAFRKSLDPKFLVLQAELELDPKTLELAIEALKAEVANSPAPRPLLLARALKLSGRPEEIDLARRLVRKELDSGSKRRDVIELSEALK